MLFPGLALTSIFCLPILSSFPVLRAGQSCPEGSGSCTKQEASIAPGAPCSLLCQAHSRLIPSQLCQSHSCGATVTQQSLGVWALTAVHVECLEQQFRV